ncbi:hypothetical protein OIV83_005276 [Microbotryomycetes sp. JL201]|nr:hypothetical protein OIV83_005276 [Microbotryomycetes sp. JL201]
MDATTLFDSSGGGASVIQRQQSGAQPSSSGQPQHTAHAAGVDVDVHNRLLREHKRLKQRVEQLERENEALRTSLWEVSWRYGKSQGRSRKDNNSTSKSNNPKDAAVGPKEQPQTTAADTNGGTRSPTAAAAHPSMEDRATTSLDPPFSPEETPKLSAAKPPLTVKSAATAPSFANGSSATGLVSAVFGETEFMRLNEPIKAPAVPTSTTSATLPTSPSSIAATLFPQPAMLPPPVPSSRTNTQTEAGLLGKSSISKATPAPSSTSSRTNTAMRDASLKRELDISLPSARTSDATAHESWRWGRGYDLKGHRGAVYTLKFGQQRLRGRGRILASAGFDGVRLWAPKDLLKRDQDVDQNDDLDDVADPWDDGEVEELSHLTSHTGPVSDIDFHPAMTHILSGGYDSQVYIHPLSERLGASSSATTTPPASTPATPTTSTLSPHAWTWSHATDGLVQTVAWIHPSTGQGAESMNLFAYGTSGRILGVGDMRMDKPVLEMRSDTMINSIRSFKRSPNLIVGDSSGAIRHFSLRSASFLPLPELSASVAAVAGGAAGRKGPAPISCLALSSDSRRNTTEPRWMASTGFDNFIRIYDRGTDPVKMLANCPKLVHALKGKNRNWPIKAAWFQGADYVDPQPVSKRRTAAVSRGRSRSASFSSDHPDHTSSDDEPLHQHSRASSAMNKRKDDEHQDRQRPLASSMLLAAGSSEPVVLLYDCTRIGESGSTSAASAGNPSAMQNGTLSGGGGGSIGSSFSQTSSASAAAPRLLQRLEGHKESVYAVDFLQNHEADVLNEGDVDWQSGGAEAYTGPGLLASAGGDWVVKTWRPVFTDVE